MERVYDLSADVIAISSVQTFGLSHIDHASLQQVSFLRSRIASVDYFDALDDDLRPDLMQTSGRQINFAAYTRMSECELPHLRRMLDVDARPVAVFLGRVAHELLRKGMVASVDDGSAALACPEESSSVHGK